MMRLILAAMALAIASTGPIQAQQLLESYTAMLSWNDHYNSNGQRLTEPWQIIRQDRSNYHRYGQADPQDEWDSFFGDFSNRARAEQMLANGYVSPQARNAIVNGPALVRVELWGHGSTATSIRVDVAGGGSMQGTGGQQTGGLQVIGSYTAFLSWNDHYNSNGQRLTEPWQIIRQDRANFHRYGERDSGDQWDSFFASIENRARAEQMLANGTITPQVRNAIVNGEVTVRVEILGQGNTGTAIRVTLF